MKLKSAVFVNALKVAFSQLEITMSAVDYHKMVAKFETGKFIDLLETSDGDGSSGLVEAIFRTLTDDADAVDVATRAFTKALQDTAHLEDTTSLLSSKSAFDVASVTDVFARSIGYGRPFLDTATVQEITAVGLQRPLGNSLSITDEILTYISGKGYSETPVATDAINSLAITKLFLDAVTATDDLDGTATPLDDQEIQFIKVRIDAATFSDFVALALSRVRAFAENLAFTDDNFFNFGKRPSDTATPSDDQEIQFTKVRTDVATFSDFVVLVQSRARAFAENLAFTDDNFFNFGARLSDTTSATDAGSLRSHNYSDFTYFSEDFVGASRTFT